MRDALDPMDPIRDFRLDSKVDHAIMMAVTDRRGSGTPIN